MPLSHARFRVKSSKMSSSKTVGSRKCRVSVESKTCVSRVSCTTHVAGSRESRATYMSHVAHVSHVFIRAGGGQVDFLVLDMRANPILRTLLRQQMRDDADYKSNQASSLGILMSRGAGDGFLMNMMGGYSKCKVMSPSVLQAKMAEAETKRAKTHFSHNSMFSKVVAHIFGMLV